MLLAIVVALLAVVSFVAFVVPLRHAGRTRLAREDGGTPAGSGADGAQSPGAAFPGPGPSTRFAGLGHLQVGVELRFDGQRWRVIGEQRVTSPTGEPWTAWHLDDLGQGGWMTTTGPDDHVFVAVRAEEPETLDPSLPTLTWRRHEWTRRTVEGGRAEGTGQRRLARRGGLVDARSGPLERVVYTRDELPARHLVLERAPDDEAWNAWIGTSVPGTLVDVWPPAGDAGQPS